MPSPIEIITATNADIPALCELLGVLFAQESEFQPNAALQQQALAEIIGNDTKGSVFVAKTPTQVLGMLSLLYSVSTALGGRVALLEDVVVHPDFRNAGIGSRLLTRAKDFARANDIRRITLLTDHTNLSAQRFYRRHGFVLSSMMPMRLTLNDENWAYAIQPSGPKQFW